ncbi:hypothetical protein CDAR_250721 [Caerostris darwini]|uniref:Uncharacterized protein n=1 Tax=Caerostris darwini TaxID=1538125 RepID=A0AAV4UGZ6_9ARAC|nr:hypothetical protein CDAR_250721 [Caerostris darwini]
MFPNFSPINVSPPKRPFNSYPVDERIPFADALKNERQLPPQNSSTIPQGYMPSEEDINSLYKILFRVKEFSLLFQPLGGIDSIFDPLQSRSNQAPKK